MARSGHRCTRHGNARLLATSRQPNHIGMRGILSRAGTGLHGWRKAYNNCLVLPISTKCIFFSIAQTIRTRRLSVLDLEQFWDGWPSGKFLKKHESEDKTLWKDSCWFVASVGNPKRRLGCYMLTLPGFWPKLRGFQWPNDSYVEEWRSGDHAPTWYVMELDIWIASCCERTWDIYFVNG
jgi:hypothetical protein